MRYFRFLASAVLSSAFATLPAQSALAGENSAFSVLPFGAMWGFSNAYTLADISNDWFISPDTSQRHPFAVGTSSFGMAAHWQNCWIGAQHAQMGAARVRQDALQGYVFYETAQYERLRFLCAPIRFQFLAYSGHGAQVGCDWMSSAWTLRLQANALHIESFRYRRYMGELVSVGKVARLTVGEELVAFEPLVSGLQSKGKRGSVLSADVMLSYRAPDETIHAETFIQNVAGELQAENVPFMRRNAHVSIDASGIIGGGRSNRIFGTYGNEDITVSLPRIWTAHGSVALKDRIYGGVHLTGINSLVHPMLIMRLRCAVCSLDEGYQLGADVGGAFVSVGYKRGSFRGSFSHRVESLSLNGINAISLYYVSNF